MTNLPAFGSEREAYGDRLSEDQLKARRSAEATLVSDLSITDLLKKGVDSTTDFLNIPNSYNFNPNETSISPYLKSPDLDGSGGNTMGVNFKFPFYG